MTTIRGRVLDEAKSLTEGDRNKQYGSPYENLNQIAKLWSVRFNRTFTASEVAIAMMDVKTSRIASNPSHEDSYVDLAAYGAIAYECAVEHYEKHKLVNPCTDMNSFNVNGIEITANSTQLKAHVGRNEKEA